MPPASRKDELMHASSRFARVVGFSSIGLLVFFSGCQASNEPANFDTGSDDATVSDGTLAETGDSHSASTQSVDDSKSTDTGAEDSLSESVDATSEISVTTDDTENSTSTTDESVSTDGETTTSDSSDTQDGFCDILGESITQDYLVEHLESIAGGRAAMVDGKMVTIPERKTAANKELARKYLTTVLEADGFTVSEHTFNGGVNLVADKPGSGDKTLLISGHLDSMDCPGADDDGSGVITALAVMHALRGCNTEAGLRFVAFDLEEAGLVGSKAYADDLAGSGEHKQLIGDFQIEMTGYEILMQEKTLKGSMMGSNVFRVEMPNYCDM